jgi:16S rRNA (cytosine967-C5)-methyltransferase
MLKNNGKLLYVTCSIFEEENKDIIEKFKQESSDAIELKIDFPENIAYINNQIIPSDNHDGLYYALIKKN